MARDYMSRIDAIRHRMAQLPRPLTKESRKELMKMDTEWKALYRKMSSEISGVLRGSGTKAKRK